MSNVMVGSEACEKCRAKGGDDKGNNRILYDDGGYYCFACSDYKVGRNKVDYSTLSEYTRLPMHTVETILSKRSISPETIKAYGITCELDESNQLYVKFPIHDVNGVETNAQFRAVDTSTGTMLKDIKFSSGKIKLPIMGWRLVGAATKNIYVCEGLTDALILNSFLGKRADTVVVGMTTATAAKRVASHILAYATDKKIVLCFDNDEAGELAEETFVQTIEKHDPEFTIHRLNIPRQFKDVGDWVAGDNNLTQSTLLESVTTLNMSGLLGSTEIAKRVGEYFDNMVVKHQLELSFSPTLSDALRLMPGKLVGVIGASGEGKSTFAEHLAMEALQQKMNVFAVSQEMLAEEFAIKLLRMVRNQPLDSPKFIRTLTTEDKVEIVGQTDKLIKLLNMTDSFGEMSVDSIDKHIHKLTSIGQHPALVIVDHLLAISSDGDRETIMSACKGLKDLARRHETCVLLLTHTSKPKNKMRGIQQPTLNEAYGSSGIPIYCDSAVGVSSDKQSCITMIETVKIERMGGTYANVTFNFSDYLLTEAQKGSNVDYSEDKEEEIESSDYY